MPLPPWATERELRPLSEAELFEFQRNIRPQPGPQTEFLASDADIVIYGGAAGGGKTWALLLEPLRHINNPLFRCIIFRRLMTEIQAEGGLMDESKKLYPLCGAEQYGAGWRWPDPTGTYSVGATVRFSHMQLPQDRFKWKGAQIPLIEFDQLEMFTADQWWYLMSRNRSVSGVKPYMRATCNPDPDSWLKRFLGPWVDPDDPRYPFVPGDTYYFVREEGEVKWVDKSYRTPDGLPAKSFAFIPATVYDNRVLLSMQPDYLTSLRTLPEIERRRLLEGDWTALLLGTFFKRQWFNIVDEAPNDLQLVRYWDLGSEEGGELGDPDFSVGVLMGWARDGTWWVLDVARGQWNPRDVDKMLRQTAILDGKHVPILIEQEPGSAGKRAIDHFQRVVLNGWMVQGDKVSGPKDIRAWPYSSAAQAGLVNLLRGHWVNPYLAELSLFPNSEYHDDQVDASSGAMNYLSSTNRRTRIVRGQTWARGGSKETSAEVTSQVRETIERVKGKQRPTFGRKGH